METLVAQSLAQSSQMSTLPIFVQEQSFGEQFHEGRHLQLYERCAVMPEFKTRKECCDEVVQSTAGRQFCYNDRIYEDGYFDSCDFPTFSETFACCDKLGGNDVNMVYDCKTSLPASGVCRKNMIPCKDNYEMGLNIIATAAAREANESREKAIADEIENENEYKSEAKRNLLLFIVSLVPVGILVILLVCCYMVYCSKSKPPVISKYPELNGDAPKYEPEEPVVEVKVKP